MDKFNFDFWSSAIYLLGVLSGYAFCKITPSQSEIDADIVDKPKDLPVYKIEISYGEYRIEQFLFEGFAASDNGKYNHPIWVKSFIRSWVESSFRVDSYTNPYNRCILSIESAVSARVGGRFQCGDLCIFEVIPVGQGVTTITDSQPIVK